MDIIETIITRAKQNGFLHTGTDIGNFGGELEIAAGQSFIQVSVDENTVTATVWDSALTFMAAGRGESWARPIDELTEQVEGVMGVQALVDSFASYGDEKRLASFRAKQNTERQIAAKQKRIESILAQVTELQAEARRLAAEIAELESK